MQLTFFRAMFLLWAIAAACMVLRARFVAGYLAGYETGYEGSQSRYRRDSEAALDDLRTMIRRMKSAGLKIPRTDRFRAEQSHFATTQDPPVPGEQPTSPQSH